MTLTPRRLRVLVTSLLVAALLGALDHTVVATSLSTIAGALGALEQMSLVVVSYTLASAVLFPLLGKVSDRFGPRRVYLVSLAAFLLASLACGLAQTMPQLVVARTAQGMSAAGLQLLSQTIVAMVTTPRQRPRVLSIVGAAFPVAILIGPLLGGVITDQLGWRWVFWINIPFGVAALVLALMAIPPLQVVETHRFDIAGAITLSIGMVAVVLAATWVGHPGQRVSTLAAAAVAVVSLLTFLRIEAGAVDPLVPLRLLRIRTVAAGIALSAIIGIGLFSVVSYIPTYIQMAYRTTVTVSGLIPIATVFGMLIANLVTGWLVSRTGHYRTFPIVGCALASAGLTAMAVLPVGLPLWVPMAVMGLVGIGTGAFMSLVIVVVQSAVPVAATASITATTNLLRQLGATVGTAVIGGAIGSGVAALLPSSIDPSTFTPAEARLVSVQLQLEVAQIYGAVFRPVFGALAAVYALGILAGLALPAHVLSDDHPAAESPAPTPR